MIPFMGSKPRKIPLSRALPANSHLASPLALGVRCPICSASCQIDLPAEDCVIFDGQAKRLNIAFHHAARPQLHTTRCGNVPLNVAHDQHILSRQVGRHMSIGTNRQAMFGKVDQSLDVTIDNQILTSLHFSSNHNCLANARLSSFGSHREDPSCLVELRPGGTGENSSQTIQPHIQYKEAPAIDLKMAQILGVLPALYANGPAPFNSRNPVGIKASNGEETGLLSAKYE